MSEKPKDQEHLDTPPSKTVEGKVEMHLAGKATSSGSVRVRLIQHSPAADPELVKEARKFARKLKKKKTKKEDLSERMPEAPLILPVPK